jgi:hypothetical protein
MALFGFQMVSIRQARVAFATDEQHSRGGAQCYRPGAGWVTSALAGHKCNALGAIV